MALVVLRCVFLMVAAGLGVQLVRSQALPQNPDWLPWAVFGGVMLVSASVIALDVLTRHKHIDILSGVYFGLIVGLFLTYVLRLALSAILPEKGAVTPWVELVLGMVLCYTCISMLLQTKDDFRFIIPYVEFAKEVKGLKPYVLDTSVVIDGRIADVVETQILDNQLIMPRFVISRTASHRRQFGPAAPHPRTPRARHPQPAASQSGRRSASLRPRTARIRRSAGRHEAGAAGQASSTARSSPTITT